MRLFRAILAILSGLLCGWYIDEDDAREAKVMK